MTSSMMLTMMIVWIILKQTNNTQTIKNCPSKDDNIEYQLDNKNDFIQTKVLSRGSKATGKFKTWYVENLDNHLSIDFDVRKWRHI